MKKDMIDDLSQQQLGTLKTLGVPAEFLKMPSTVWDDVPKFYDNRCKEMLYNLQKLIFEQVADVLQLGDVKSKGV